MPADLARQMARLALCAWPRLAACQTILNAIGNLLAGGCQVEEFLFAEDIFGFFGKLPIHRCLGPKAAELAVKEHHVLLDGLAADVQAIGGEVRVGVANRQAAQNRRSSVDKKGVFQSRGPAQRNIEKGLAEIGPVGFVLASERCMAGVRRCDHERISIGEGRYEDARIASRNDHDLVSHAGSLEHLGKFGWRGDHEPFFRSERRKKSMWQLDNAATSASSGSTPEGTEKRKRHNQRWCGRMHPCAAIEEPLSQSALSRRRRR